MLKRDLVILVATTIFFLIAIRPIEVKADTCFVYAYNASFTNNLGISRLGSFPYGSFSYSGNYSFYSNGFRGPCLSINVSEGGYAYVYKDFDAKGSFKMSFILKINEVSSFNFTKMTLVFADSSTYEIKLGFVNHSESEVRLIVYRLDRRNEGATFSPGKWYNLTIWLDASADALTIFYNGSQIKPIPTGVKLFLIKKVGFYLGVIDPAPRDAKTFFDEFSMSLSPIIFTDKSIYTSSSSVQVRISGDQFFAPSLNLTIIHPNDSTITECLRTTNDTGGFSCIISLTNPSPGTYTMRANSGGCMAEYHFGVWDIPRTWERKSIIVVKAGGLVRGGFATLRVKNSTDVILSYRLESNSEGEVNSTVPIPVDFQLGSLTAFIESDGTFDFSNMKVSTDGVGITVTKAVLNVTVIINATTYERVKPIDIRVRVTYKDGSSLHWNGIVKLSLVHKGVEGREIFMDYTYDGYWFKSVRTGPSDDLGDYLIKVEASDQYGNTGSGNRSFTLTIAKLRIAIKDRLNEAYERSTKLNVSVSIVYPDGTPLTSGSVALEMIGDRYKRQVDFRKVGPGEWNISWKIPLNEDTGRLTLRIIAVDEAGNSGDLSQEIRIIPARLNIQLLTQLNDTFSRTEKIPVNVVIKYPSHEFLKLEDGGRVNVSLIHNGIEEVSTRLRFSSGSWIGNISAPRDSPLGRYMLNISARDMYGNYGLYVIPVEVTKAALGFEIEGLKEIYQVGFETVSLKITVRYPDASTLGDGNVTVKISSGTFADIIRLRYQGGKWIGDYYLSITSPVGEYTVVINATDPYGNTGVKEAYFRTSNLYLILIVISFAIVLAVPVSLLWLRRRRVQPPPIMEGYDVLA